MVGAIYDCRVVQHQLLQPPYIFTGGGAHQQALAGTRDLHSISLVSNPVFMSFQFATLDVAASSVVKCQGCR